LICTALDTRCHWRHSSNRLWQTVPHWWSSDRKSAV